MDPYKANRLIVILITMFKNSGLYMRNKHTKQKCDKRNKHKKGRKKLTCLKAVIAMKENWLI
jgi:hypothetical protein